MMDVYERQRSEARASILGAGAALMRTPIDIQQALYEDANIYALDIATDYPGPRVRLSINGWNCDYWPCLTYERALKCAEAA